MFLYPSSSPLNPFWAAANGCGKEEKQVKKGEVKEREWLMGFCVGAYALERWLGLNCFSFSLSWLVVHSRLLQQGPPLLLMSSFRRAMPEPPIYRRSIPSTRKYTPWHSHHRLFLCFFVLTRSINYLMQLFIHKKKKMFYKDAPF